MFYLQLSHVLRPTRSCLHLLHPLNSPSPPLSYISPPLLQHSHHLHHFLTLFLHSKSSRTMFRHSYILALVRSYVFSYLQHDESHAHCWYTAGILFHSCTTAHTFFLQNTISPACCWAHSCLFIPLLPLSYTSFHFYSPSSIFILLSIHKHRKNYECCPGHRSDCKSVTLNGYHQPGRKKAVFHDIPNPKARIK